MPVRAQRELAVAMHAFAQAAGEVPDSEWPAVSPFRSDEGTHNSTSEEAE